MRYVMQVSDFWDLPQVLTMYSSQFQSLCLTQKYYWNIKTYYVVFFVFPFEAVFFPLTYRKIKSSKKWKKRVRTESSINWFRNKLISQKLISQIFKAFWLGKFEEFFLEFFVKHQFLNWEESSRKSPLQNSIMDFLESETQKCNLSTNLVGSVKNAYQKI